jgi:PAS domain S-box-containing protein
MTENIPVGTYIIHHDEAGRPRFMFVSAQWLRMLDLRREDVLADPSLAFQAVHPEEREAFVRLSDEAMAACGRFSWEGRILVNGSTRWVSIESTPRRRPEGGTIWEGVMIDVTQRVEAVEALAQSELRHRRHAAEVGFRRSAAGGAEVRLRFPVAREASQETTGKP